MQDGCMTNLTVDDIRTLLPEVDEVRPLLEQILALARPDDTRRWTVSGELGTVGRRLVDPSEVEAVVPAVLEELQAHLAGIYHEVSRAVAAQADGRPEDALNALQKAAEIEQNRGRLADADAFIASALRVTDDLTDRTRAIPAFLQGARIARAAGHWETAEERYVQALHLASAAGDAEAAATAAIGAGNLAVDRGIWPLARERYDRAEQWVEGLPEGSPELWHLALNRSIVAREEGQLDEAEQFLRQAEAIAGREPKGPTAAVLLNARGQLLRARGQGEDAELAFRQALTEATEIDARVTIRVNLADTLLDAGRSLDAGQVAREAEEVALAKRVIPRLPEVYRMLGRVAAVRGHSDAFVFFERALEVSRETRLPDFERALTLEAYGRYDKDRGEGETARARLREAAGIYQTIGCRPAAERVEALLQAGDDSGADGRTNES